MLILFNGIQLHIITVVIICKYIFVIICHYSFISGMLWASLDRLLGKNLCIKCIIQVPTKHPNERVLQITWKNQFIAFYRVPPKCETCMRLLPKSPEHWVQHQLVQLKAHLHLHLAAVFEGRSGFEGQLNLFVIPNSSLFWDIHGYSGHLWTAYWGETSV
jgi:hypothetical protein